MRTRSTSGLIALATQKSGSKSDSFKTSTVQEVPSPSFPSSIEFAIEMPKEAAYAQMRSRREFMKSARCARPCARVRHCASRRRGPRCRERGPPRVTRVHPHRLPHRATHHHKRASAAGRAKGPLSAIPSLYPRIWLIPVGYIPRWAPLAGPFRSGGHLRDGRARVRPHRTACRISRALDAGRRGTSESRCARERLRSGAERASFSRLLGRIAPP